MTHFWREYGTDFLRNSKKVKWKYCSKTFSGGIFIFKHHQDGNKDDVGACAFVLDIKYLFMKIVVESDDPDLKKKDNWWTLRIMSVRWKLRRWKCLHVKSKGSLLLVLLLEFKKQLIKWWKSDEHVVRFSIQVQFLSIV